MKRQQADSLSGGGLCAAGSSFIGRTLVVYRCVLSVRAIELRCGLTSLWFIHTGTKPDKAETCRIVS